MVRIKHVLHKLTIPLCCLCRRGRRMCPCSSRRPGQPPDSRCEHTKSKGTVIKTGSGHTPSNRLGQEHYLPSPALPFSAPIPPSPFLQLNIQLRAFVGWQEVASYRAGLGAKQVQLRSALEERLLGQVGAAARLLG